MNVGSWTGLGVAVISRASGLLITFEATAHPKHQHPQLPHHGRLTYPQRRQLAYRKGGHGDQFLLRARLKPHNHVVPEGESVHLAQRRKSKYQSPKIL